MFTASVKRALGFILAHPVTCPPASLQNGILAAEDAETAGHVFRLRADLEVTFQQPPSLTGGEAERLSAFIRTLPL